MAVQWVLHCKTSSCKTESDITHATNDSVTAADMDNDNDEMTMKADGLTLHGPSIQVDAAIQR